MDKQIREQHLWSPMGLMLAGGQSLTPDHSVSQKLILCIDDDPAILFYEKALLERSGYSVTTAASPQQGLGLVNTSNFDAIDVPAYALAVVDAFILKLEASRELVPMVAALCSRTRDPQQKQEGSRLQRSRGLKTGLSDHPSG